jgi:hypothetical protein
MPMQVISRLSDGYGVVAETSGFCMANRRKSHVEQDQGQTIGNWTKEPARRVDWCHGVGSGCCLGKRGGPRAMAVPGEACKVHVEGQLIPVEQSHDVYRMTGDLVGTYKLRSERVSHAWTYWDTEIRDIDGTASMRGCVDQNQNQSCDPAEPSGDLKLASHRVGSFDTETGRLIEGVSTYQLSSGGRFNSGVLTTRDIPVHNSDGVVLTHEGDLEVTQPTVNSRRAD